jgi:hypothetical protein
MNRVLSLLTDTGSAQASVKVLPSYTLKVILTGEPSSEVIVLIAYDTRKLK